LPQDPRLTPKDGFGRNPADLGQMSYPSADICSYDSFREIDIPEAQKLRRVTLPSEHFTIDNPGSVSEYPNMSFDSNFPRRINVVRRQSDRPCCARENYIQEGQPL